MKKNWKDYLRESSLSRIYRHYTEHDSGTISAFRYAPDCGDGKPYTKKQNGDRNAILKALLLKSGYSVTPIDGSYIENYQSDNEIEVDEESFFVLDIKDFGNLKETLIKLGTKFDQDSITFSKKSGEYYLISSNECENGYPGSGKIGVEVKLGGTIFGEDGEFFSKVKGRPFIFKKLHSKTEILEHHFPTEIRSINELGKREIV